MGFSVDQLVADCAAAVQDSDGHSGVAVEEVLARAISDPAAIEAAIGHPRDMAVFSTWFNSDELTVLHVVWPPAVDLMAHDHLMWAAIGLYGGREDNRVFRSLPDGSLEHRRTKTLRGGDTILLGDDTVHAVANPSREWTGAIHVYGGDYFRDGKHMWSDTEQAAGPFDVDALRKVLSDAAIQAKKREPSE
jgi:predicted metal-dependent enzyme (double-stranded beta helix superfamily)